LGAKSKQIVGPYLASAIGNTFEFAAFAKRANAPSLALQPKPI